MFYEDFTGQWGYDPTEYQDTRHARLCVGCEQGFYPAPCPPETALACGGGYPLGDMRLSYCENCLPAAFAGRDAFYAQCMKERRIKCQLEGHFPDGARLPSVCLICGENIDEGAATLLWFSAQGIGVPA